MSPYFNIMKTEKSTNENLDTYIELSNEIDQCISKGIGYRVLEPLYNKMLSIANKIQDSIVFTPVKIDKEYFK